MSWEPYIIGIAGGSASGKTSFLKDLKQKMPKGSVCIISQDNYYKPIAEQQKDENGEINFDLPNSIDRDRFYDDLKKLKLGESIKIKEYTFNNTGKVPGHLIVKPSPVIVMEGLFIFHYEEIRKSLDLRVYIDAHESVKLERRIKRDSEERGYPEDTVRYQWDNHVMPSYKKFLRPYRDDCHIIVTNNSHYTKGLNVLTNHLRYILPKEYSDRFIEQKINVQ
ncbi:uridine-cytidine kinase [Flavobacteriales bacterium]|nr:uridine-cytidine kinase [Flavobacteriales bacterium]